MTLSRDAVEGLRAQFSGEVLEASDPGYDAARAVHNGLIDKRPALDRHVRSTPPTSPTRCASPAPRVSRSRFAVAGTTSPARP